MKKCPTCEKTFEDSMRFCQVDGTPLVDDAPAFDPYATIVAQPMPVPPTQPEPATFAPEPSNAPDAGIHQTVGSIPIGEPEDVLDLPSSDPLKTMYVSEDEMKAALTGEQAADIMEIPPIEEISQPEPPSFLAPDPTPSAAPPSPFSVPAEPEPVVTFDSPEPQPYAVDEPAAPPVFDAPPAPVFEEPSKLDFEEAATMIQPSFQSPFDQTPAAPVAEWTPPPAPEPSWQNQEVGANTPFQPPAAGTAGQNKTLAIVSLVAGILGMTICCGGLIPSIVALVTGFMARGRANANPEEYGGAGLAMGGIVTGALGLVLGIVLIILQIVFGVLSNVR